MSQIRASSLTNLRGRAYKCLHCQGPNPCIGEKRRVESHVYKTHLPLERSPFYCKICTFRCTAQEDLEKHVLSFGPHKSRETEYRDQNREADFDIEKFLLRSTNPYYVTAIDMQCLSGEESEQIWRERRRHVHITAAITATQSQLNTPPPIQRQANTPLQDENVWDYMMGPTQYSADMTITPTRVVTQSTAPLSAHFATTLTSRVLSPAYHSASEFCTTSLPSVNSLMPAALRSSLTTTATVVHALPSPVLPSGCHPLYGTVITTPAVLGTSVNQSIPSMTLIQPTVPTSSFPLTVPGHSHPIMSSPISGTSTTTSPISTAVYSPKYPTYTPTPIVRDDATKTSNVLGENRQIKANASVSEQARGKEIVNALHELTTTLNTAINGMSKAVEDQTLLLGAIHQQIKNFVRSSEDEIRKREREEDAGETRRVKSKKTKK